MACLTAPLCRVAEGEGEDALPWWSTLTTAERNVARLVAEFMSDSEIGVRLGVSPRTIEKHLAHIYRKAPVSNRRELGRAIQRARGARPR